MSNRRVLEDKITLGSTSELQARLRYIESRTDEIRLQEEDAPEYVKEILYLLGYVTKILRKHLETDER